MEYLLILFLFIIGLCVGSFLNVVIYRIRTGESFVKGRSKCDYCGKKIAWYDNIPLLSFLLLRGKCRYCKKKIPIDNLLVELLVGIQFVWVYWLLKVNFVFFGQIEGVYSLSLLIYWLLLLTGSFGIAIYDFKHMIVPGEILWFLIIISGFRLFFSSQWQVIPVCLLSGLGMFMIFWLANKITRKEAMGFGDVQLAFLMGLVLGFPRVLVGFFISFLTGALVGVILVLISKKKFKDKMAFGPFLLFGMWVAKLWGDKIWQWYINFLK